MHEVRRLRALRFIAAVTLLAGLGVRAADASYLVIDLSAGPLSESYPVSDLAEVPAGGWTDEYKTTKLVLRRLPAGAFLMGSPTNELGYSPDETLHQVALSHAFYIGVFEVTQKQWERVMGTWPSLFCEPTVRDSRPVESVSYDAIRGVAAGASWPLNSSVDSTSFLGRLRSRTGLSGLDLPTEAEWEYACRAGTSTSLNSGKNISSQTACNNLAEVGRYAYNGGTPSYSYSVDRGSASVGSYPPNSWGLYDMHGNVREWCLDWYWDYPSTAVDPVGPSTGFSRVLRGGDWCETRAQWCRSAARYRSTEPSSDSGSNGLRVALPLPDISVAVHTVTFDLGIYGERTGGGQLEQHVTDGASAWEPTLTVTNDYWQFTGWDADFSSITADLAVHAQYAEITYPLVVNHGTGSGDYVPWTPVAIAADPAPAGKQFSHWVVEPVEYQSLWTSGASPDQITFATRRCPVTFTAIYEFIAPQWRMMLDVASDTPHTLTFGMDADATDGWDEGVDVAFADPGPGRAWLVSDDFSQCYDTELRVPVETGEFLLAVSAGETDLTVSWTFTGLFPDSKMLIFYQVVPESTVPGSEPIARHPVGNTAIYATDSLQVPAGETRYYAMRYANELAFDLKLDPGWNLVSLPLEPVDPAPAAVFGDSAARASDGAADVEPGRGTAARDVCAWTNGTFVAATGVQGCAGYWVYADAATVRIVPGYPSWVDAIEVRQGWNLLGVPWARPVFSDPLIQGPFWFWDAAQLRYQAATELLPGHAYWFYAPAAGLLDPPWR